MPPITIQLDQTPLVAGTPGSSREDLVLGTPVVCTDPANGAGSYSWTLQAPPGSSAVLTGETTDTATFTPDVRGTYLVYLDFDGTLSYTLDANNLKVSTQGGAGVKYRNGVRALGTGETFQFAAVHGWAEDFVPYFATIDAVTAAKGAAQGTLFFSNSDGDLEALAPGTAGRVLATQGAGADPTWVVQTSTLQGAYDGGASIITGPGGAVAMSRVLGDTTSVLSLTKNPGSAFAGSALAIVMGANATGPAIDMNISGSSLALNANVALKAGVGGTEALQIDTNLDTRLAGSLLLKERATEAADITNYGQIWAKTDQTLWFTDSLGVDFELGLPTTFLGLGSPTYNSHQDARDTLSSAGLISGGEITDDGDGTITVAAGTGLIRATDSPVAILYNTDWAAESGTNVDLTSASMNYVYVEYNAGAPRVVARTVKSSDSQTDILLGTVYKNGSTTLHISEENHRHINDHTGLMIDRLVQTEPFDRGTGGIISETGTRNIALTAGIWWHGIHSFTSAAFDTSAADTFFYIYRDGVGGWTSVASSTQISNTQYDDGDGTLGLLTGNKYGVHWVFLGQDDDHYVVYGRGDYTLPQAQDAGVPADLPPWFAENHARVVGKAIIQKDAATFTSIETPFETQFTGAIPTDHGSLIGLGDDDHAQYLPIDGTRAMTGAILEVDGTVGAPAYSFASETNTGWRLASASAPALTVFGTDRYTFFAASLRLGFLSSAAVPAFANAVDNNTGPFWLGSNVFGLSTGGVEAMRLDASQNAIFAEAIELQQGKKLHLDNTGNNHLYANAVNEFLVTLGGVPRLQFNSADAIIWGSGGSLRPALTNNANLGKSNFRWLNVYGRVLDLRFDAVGTGETIGALIANETDAAAGAQQHSPMLVLGGEGHASTPVTSQLVRFAQQVIPIQGTTLATGDLVFKSSINGAAYGNEVRITSDGHIGTQDADSASAPNLYSLANPDRGYAIFAGNLALVHGTRRVIMDANQFRVVNNGSESLPSTVFGRDDSDTGAWSPGANILAFSTGAAEALRLDASQDATFAADISVPLGSHIYFDGDGSRNDSIAALVDAKIQIRTANAVNAIFNYLVCEMTPGEVQRQIWTTNTTGLPVSTIIRDAMGMLTVLTDLDEVGLRLQNTTAAASDVTRQVTPALAFEAHRWNTADEVYQWLNYGFSHSTGGGEPTVTDGLRWEYSDGTFAPTEQMSLAAGGSGGFLTTAGLFPFTTGVGSIGASALRWDNLYVGNANISGELDHNGTTAGFYGTTPITKPTAYTLNATVVTSKTLLASASATAVNNNNVIAQLITDLQALGLVA